MHPLVSNSQMLLRKLDAVNRLRSQLLEKNAGKPILTVSGAQKTILRCWESKRGRGLSRIIVGIGGCPASGKTTAAKRISCAINDCYHTTLAAHLPMDGFHYSNERLTAEGFADTKGEKSTYDVSAYVRTLLQYKASAGADLWAPDYVRERHEVVANRIEIRAEVRVLVTEGIYVGYPAGKWSEVRELLDVVLYLDVSPEECADRIVSRNLEVGRSTPAFIEKKLSNDFDFMNDSVQILQSADYLIRPA
jgi:pantothenate kinase